MTFVGLLGLILSALGFPLAFRRATASRTSILILLTFFHIAASLAYFLYSKYNPADAAGYYYNYGIWMHLPWFSPGTGFIAHIVAAMRLNLGASLLDCFFVFQAVGLLGILYLFRTFIEISENVGGRDTALPMYLLFMPTLNFWTAAVGKDAPVFLGVGLVTWAMMYPKRRMVALLSGMFIMMMFRPHIALITVVALALSASTYRNFSAGLRIFLLGMASAAFLFFAASVKNALAVDVTSLSSVSGFFNDRSAIEALDQTGTSIGNAPYFIKLLSLLFRPFFFDARGAFALLASLENLMSVLLFGFLLKNWSIIRNASNQVYFVRFSCVYSIVLILMIAVENYNVGLGLRQRLMAIPPLFAAFVSIWNLKHVIFNTDRLIGGPRVLGRKIGYENEASAP